MRIENGPYPVHVSGLGAKLRFNYMQAVSSRLQDRTYQLNRVSEALSRISPLSSSPEAHEKLFKRRNLVFNTNSSKEISDIPLDVKAAGRKPIYVCTASQIEEYATWAAQQNGLKDGDIEAILSKVACAMFHVLDAEKAEQMPDWRC